VVVGFYRMRCPKCGMRVGSSATGGEAVRIAGMHGASDRCAHLGRGNRFCAREEWTNFSWEATGDLSR
jgi:hypothetical protein